MPTSEQYKNRYPIYILSKGRYDTMFTMKSLDELGLNYSVAVEPQEYDLYKEALKDTPFATVLVLPFSNHGLGGGPARNYCWEHSQALGFKRHWILDDNIKNFYRFHNNKRIRVNTGAIFRAAEDYVDRFENVPLSGFQYHFFCPDNYNHPPVLLNTRVMSCLLIENSCKHKWRAKYNEDVDLSLRILKDGDVTMLFYTFLCGKLRTGTVKGGNTTELYGKGTFEKSKMLVDLHPDVVSLVQKYGRWHHQVDMRPFRDNKLRYVKDFKMPNADNNYGMQLAYNFGMENQKIVDPELIKQWDFD